MMMAAPTAGGPAEAAEGRVRQADMEASRNVRLRKLRKSGKIRNRTVFRNEERFVLEILVSVIIGVCYVYADKLTWSVVPAAATAL